MLLTEAHPVRTEDVVGAGGWEAEIRPHQSQQELSKPRLKAAHPEKIAIYKGSALIIEQKRPLGPKGSRDE